MLMNTSGVGKSCWIEGEANDHALGPSSALKAAIWSEMICRKDVASASLTDCAGAPPASATIAKTAHRASVSLSNMAVLQHCPHILYENDWKQFLYPGLHWRLTAC